MTGIHGVADSNNGFLLAHTPQERALIRNVLHFVPSSGRRPLCYCAPSVPQQAEESSYDTLKSKLKSQFGEKKLVLAERYHFYTYKQQDKQSFSWPLSVIVPMVSRIPRRQFAWQVHDRTPEQKITPAATHTRSHTNTLDELFQLATTLRLNAMQFNGLDHCPQTPMEVMLRCQHWKIPELTEEDIITR